MKNLSQIRKNIRNYFDVISDDAISDKQRNRRLRKLRTRLKEFEKEEITKAAKLEKKNCDNSFMYQLFLMNIIKLKML